MWCSWRVTRRSMASAAKPARWASTTNVRMALGSSAAWENWWDTRHRGRDVDATLCISDKLADSEPQEYREQCHYDANQNGHIKISEVSVEPIPIRMCLFRNHSLCVSVLVHLWPPSFPCHCPHHYIITVFVLDNSNTAHCLKMLTSSLVKFCWYCRHHKP